MLSKAVRICLFLILSSLVLFACTACESEIATPSPEAPPFVESGDSETSGIDPEKAPDTLDTPDTLATPQQGSDDGYLEATDTDPTGTQGTQGSQAGETAPDDQKQQGHETGDNGRGDDNNAQTSTPASETPVPVTTPSPEPEPPSDQAPSVPTPSPEPVPSPTAAPPDDGPIVLTITGSGVTGETTWTLGRLKSLSDGYRECTYSTTNNWPSFGHMRAHGISLSYLLNQAGVRSNAASFRFKSTDGYNITLTRNQVFGTRYTYSTHSPTGSSGASAADPIIAWEWGDVGRVRQENIRPFFGQSGPMDVNTAAFVKDLASIEVSTASAGTWAAPSASIADDKSVPAGTKLEFTHASLDNIRIYYTLDGSEPGYSSPVYNRSATYFQPQLIVPIILTENVTVKAFAAGIGRDPSPVITLNFKVG